MTYYFSVLGWEFLCWRGENWRNLSHAEETPSFPQVRSESHSRWILIPRYPASHVCLLAVYYLSLLAVTTCSGGTCSSCCRLSYQWRTVTEELHQRYQHCLFKSNKICTNGLNFYIHHLSFCKCPRSLSVSSRCCWRCCSVCRSAWSGPSTPARTLWPREWVIFQVLRWCFLSLWIL